MTVSNIENISVITRMRQCPKCKIPMAQNWLYRQEIERCGQCNGIFLDEGELGDIVRLMRIYRSVGLDENEIVDT